MTEDSGKWISEDAVERCKPKIYIQGVPELADQIETVYSLMVMKVKNV
jgi:hypothetical protein